MPVADRERVPVKRTCGGSRGAVSFGVELTSMTRAAESAGGERRNDADLAVRGVLRPPLLCERRAVRLRRAADMRAPARHHGEARYTGKRAVVPHERGT